MKSKGSRTVSRAQQPKHIQGDGLNWVFIAGGALLSTLSIRLGYKLKQALERKQPDDGNVKSSVKRRTRACPLHSNAYSFTQDDDGCYNCISGISDGLVEMKQPPTSPMLKETDLLLPLVAVTAPESNKENGMIWASSSPDRLELPRKLFHNSNSSESLCMSESGSDVFSKREVIQKLRQQLKKRDEMILEMQGQVTDLQNSLTAQLTQLTHLQSQLDSVNQDLFESDREIQRLRKIIADHCVGEMRSLEKPAMAGNWRAEPKNGQVNGFIDGLNQRELHLVGTGRTHNLIP